MQRSCDDEATISLLREGILAARSGEKARAQAALREVVRASPDNEVAWVWLAQTAETPAAAALAFEKVLCINPNNLNAYDALSRVRLEAGIEAARSGRRDDAREHLLGVVAAAPTNDEAWFWLATVTEPMEERVEYLRRVLELNPNRSDAMQALHRSQIQTASAEQPQNTSAGPAVIADSADAEITTDLSRQSGPQKNRRGAARYDYTVATLCDLHTSIHSGDATVREQWKGQVLDLSTTGLRLLLGRRFEHGTMAAVLLENPAQTFLLHVFIRIVWCTQWRPKKWLLGATFPQPLEEESLTMLLWRSPSQRHGS